MFSLSSAPTTLNLDRECGRAVPRAAPAAVNSTQASGRPAGDRQQGVLQPVRDPDPGSPCSRQREGTLWGPSEPERREARLEQAGGGDAAGSPSGRGQRPPRVRGGDRWRGTPAWPPSSESRAAHPGRLIRLHLRRGDRSRGSGFSAPGGLRPPLHAPCAARVPAKNRAPTAGVARARAGRPGPGPGRSADSAASQPPGPRRRAGTHGPAAPRPATLAAACARSI